MLHTDTNTLNLIFINYIQDVLKGSTLVHEERIEKKFCFSLQFSFNSHGVIVKNYKYQILKFEKHCFKETCQTRDCLKEIQQPSPEPIYVSRWYTITGLENLCKYAKPPGRKTEFIHVSFQRCMYQKDQQIFQDRTNHKSKFPILGIII